MNNKIVVFVGRMGSGKTTLANYLADHLGYKKVSFADPIRNMLRGLGLTTEDMQEGKYINHPLLSGRNPRFALQTLGTEWARDIMHKNFWVNIWKYNTLNFSLGEQFVATDDCRFDNEAATVKKIGGTLIRINRDGVVKDSHRSEAEIDGIQCDYEIDNNGSIVDAKNQLIELLGLRGGQLYAPKQ
jgi:energy-coupling factor transporter ATP-binding protein EcfA2